MELHDVRGPRAANRLARNDDDAVAIPKLAAAEQQAIGQPKHIVGGGYVGRENRKNSVLHRELPCDRFTGSDCEYTIRRAAVAGD